MTQTRTLRYAVAVSAILAGALCAAALTNGLGNTLATVLIGGGMLAIVIFLLRDLGIGDAGAPPRPPRRSSPDDEHHGSGSSSGAGPRAGQRPSARRTVSVRRPERMRGRRRRLR